MKALAVADLQQQLPGGAPASSWGTPPFNLPKCGTQLPFGNKTLRSSRHCIHAALWGRGTTDIRCEI